MKRLTRNGMLSQMLIGQAVIVLVSGLILMGTALLLAPSIFNEHLKEAGIDSTEARLHVSEAYSTAMTVSLVIAAMTSILISGCIGWYLIRRFVTPIEEMAEFASALVAGAVDMPAKFSVTNSELDTLAAALSDLSHDLASSRAEQARMLSDLAHELRTPIATIQAIIDGIEDGVVSGNTESWKTIREQLERLTRLSRDVRDISDNADLVLKPLHELQQPHELCQSAFSAWLLRYEEKGVLLSCNSHAGLAVVNADAQRIGQVLSNLLENALRHTPKGGRVVISADESEHFLEISVTDNGEGILSEHLPHVFERLFRGDPSRSFGDFGSGLGMTIARSIAENHGGNLSVTSEGLGRGSTFTLSLPKADIAL